MQASARTCGRSLQLAYILDHAVCWRIKCRLKSSQYTLTIPHRVIQLLFHSGSPRQGCASHKLTNRSVPSEANEVLKLSSVFISSSFTGEVSAFNQSEAMFAELGEYSQNMLSEAFWAPKIASSQLDE